MVLVHVPDTANTIERLLVTNVAANGINRVGGIYDNPTFANNLRGLRDQSLLGVFRMNSKVVAHQNTGPE